MASPLTDLRLTSRVCKWIDECTKAFEKVKYSLTHAPVFWMPDFSKPFGVMADASKFASSSVLQEGQPIAFDRR